MPKRVTTEDFIAKAQSRLGDRWDYSQVVYKSATKDKVIISCKEHGITFEQTPANHLAGKIGCSKCSKKFSPVKTEDFIRSATELFGDRWDYSKVEYENNITPVTIICPKHSLEFQQTPRDHSAGNIGCTTCAKRGGTNEWFLERAKEVWEDRWDYSKVEFKNVASEITIICPEHGEFQQTGMLHLAGKVGCKACTKWVSPSEFKEMVMALYPQEIDFSKMEYVNLNTHVTLICSKHGEFSQKPHNVVAGKIGCTRCAAKTDPVALKARCVERWGGRWDYSKTSFDKTYAVATFICRKHGEFTQKMNYHVRGQVGCSMCSGRGSKHLRWQDEAQAVWGNRWDYSKAVYISSTDHITIICKEHGEFEQSLDSHIKGNIGCVPCRNIGVSKAEKSLMEFVENLLGRPLVQNSKGLLGSRYEIDMYDPETRVAIEFNGVYYHSEEFKEKKYHFDKFKMAAEQGIKLLQIWEDDWALRTDIVKEHLRQVFGRSSLPKVPARKTVVREVESHIAQNFLEQHHIQGFVPSSHYIGAFYGEDLVALATFKRQDEDFALTRYATAANVQGGHSKIVAYFERNFEYRNLITFADLTFGSGGLYQATGWKAEALLPPDYSYVVRGVRRHKFGYRLKKFRDDPTLQYVEGMTEKELADLNGLRRIWDAGKIRFIKPHP